MSRRIDDIVQRWVRLYTRGLPAEAALQRRDEMHSDLFEHREAAKSAGQSEKQAAHGIMWRAFAGVGSDILWREHELRRTHRAAMLALPPALRRRRSHLTAFTLVLGSLAVSVGALAVVRLWMSGGANHLAPTNREAILATTIACLISLLFVARPSSRFAGMLGLAVAVVPLMFGVVRALDGISARAAYLLSRLLNLVPGEMSLWFAYLSPGLLMAVAFFGSAFWLRRHSPTLTESTFIGRS